MKNGIIIYSGREGSSPLVWSLEKHIKIIRPFFEELDDKNSNSYLT
jgi:hypothetical protein